jgi:hypothetical protein
VCEWLIRAGNALAGLEDTEKYPHHVFDLVYILALHWAGFMCGCTIIASSSKTSSPYKNTLITPQITSPHLNNHLTPTTASMKFTTPLLLATTASAHTIFTSLNGGAVGDGVRVPTYDGPINDVSSNDIVCNGGPNPTAKTNTVITVQAGSTATLTWRHTLTSGADDVIDSSHKGPVMAYLKKVSDAKSDSGVGSGWFKVRCVSPIFGVVY